MLKKIIGVILLSMGITCSLLVNAEGIDHVCSGEYENVEMATCEKEGSMVQKCDICGKTLNTLIIEPLGHDFQHCVCSRCRKITDTDEENKEIILRQSQLKPYIAETTVVPSEYNGYKVIGIGSGAFYKNKEIKEVILPDSLSYIGRFAFKECSNLRFINLEDTNVKYIELAAFELCTGLESLEFPDTLEYLDNFSFNHLPNLNVASLNIPESIEEIGDNNKYFAHMFYDFGGSNFKKFTGGNKISPVIDGILYGNYGKTLISIPRGKVFENGIYVMPDSVESLGELSFSRNTNIKEVVLSDNLVISSSTNDEERSIYQNKGNELAIATYGYCSIERYSAKETNPNYTSKDGIIYSKDMSRVVAIPNHYDGDICIPEGTTSWEEGVLWDDGINYFRDTILCNISKVSLPSTLSYMDSVQIDALNLLHDYYGTVIEVSSDNVNFKVENGYLVEI